MLRLSPEYLANHQFYKGTGCKKCGHTGYKGRIGIYEIFQITEDIARLVFANESSGVIREAARRAGFARVILLFLAPAAPGRYNENSGLLSEHPVGRPAVF